TNSSKPSYGSTDASSPQVTHRGACRVGSRQRGHATMVRMTATVRVAPALRFFLTPRHRHGDVLVTVDGTSSLVHIIGALGVPRTEFGTLEVNGVPSTPDSRPTDGDVIDVPDRPRPQRLRHERFVLDIHLGALARRMRLLGLDTAYPDEAGDDHLVD